MHGPGSVVVASVFGLWRGVACVVQQMNCCNYWRDHDDGAVAVVDLKTALCTAVELDDTAAA